MTAIAVQFPGYPEFLYDQPSVVIGRRPPADVIVWDDTVSRRHAELTIEVGEVVVRDLNSSGGIFLESERVKAAPMGQRSLQLGKMKLTAKVAPPESEPSLEDQRRARSAESTGHALDHLAHQHGSLARLVAANPQAPASLLQLLASFPDRRVQEAVAGNPNTPRALYLSLGERYPAVFWSNPQLLLLQLEDPSLMSLSAYELSVLLVAPTAPIEQIRTFLNHTNEAVREMARRALRLRELG